MTLIRFRKYGNLSVLGGDIVVSSEQSFRDKNMKLPLLPRGGVHAKTNITGALQKIVKISDDFYVAFAGPVITARMVLRDLMEKCPKPHDVNEIFNTVRAVGLAQSAIDELSLIFYWSFEDSNGSRCFSVNSINTYAHDFEGDILLTSGSGDGHSRYLDLRFDQESDTGVSDAMSDEENILHDELKFYLNPLLDEMTSRGNLELAYGGFFEVVSNTYGKLQKVPIVIYIIQRLDIQSEAVVHSFFLVTTMMWAIYL